MSNWSREDLSLSVAKLYKEADVLAESITDLGETKINVRISDKRLVSLMREVGRSPVH